MHTVGSTRVFAGVVLLLAATACASGSSSSASPAPAPVQAGSFADVRRLALLPRSPSVCPGELIPARYEATRADGARLEVTPADLSKFYRSADAADPRDDGGWQTAANPFASVISGFALRVVLRADTAIHADTVVVPSYSCAKTTFDASRSIGPSFVRLGVFATPFHDSIVVAAFEVAEQPPVMVILGPAELKPGVIRVDASGRQGARGQNGRRAPDTQPCQNGADGENGGDGGDGGMGRQVDIIVQSDAPWLVDLVRVVNPGGRGGDGGTGALGGRANTSGGGRAGSCASRPGRNGRSGRPGSHGGPGPRPRVLNVLPSMLWSGAPIWSDTQTRYALQKLIDYTAKK